MGDDNKILNQNTPTTNQVIQDQPQLISQPTNPVGAVSKETEPTTSAATEFVKPSEAEPQIDRDLRELGVEANKDVPEITDEHAGVEHAKQFAPVLSSSQNKVTMPMSEEEIAVKLKAGQDDDSEKWLARLLKKIIAWGFRSQ